MRRKLSTQPLLALIAFLSAVLLSGGCGDDRPDVLSLDIDGRRVELPLQTMDVFLVDPDFEREYPESFEIIGPDVVLVGKFPMTMRVGYGENFSTLHGKPIAIARETVDAREPKRSSLILPGGGQALVEGGSFIVNRVGKGQDAKTPIAGTVTLKLRTPGGAERTVNGTFKVRGTTWG